MQQQFAQIRDKFRELLPSALPYFPLFYIWGLQWIFSSLTGLLDYGSFPVWLQPASIAAAAMLSLIVLAAAKPQDKDPGGWKTGLVLSLPYLLLLASGFLLMYLEVVNRYYFHLAQSLFLSFFYVQMGVLLGRALIYLGIWLFALCAVIGTAYLGFSPFALELLGGASLIVCGMILRSWAKKICLP